jgi:hypothetical protein
MFKRVFFLMLTGGACLAAWQATHPAPVAAGDEATITAGVSNSFAGRMKHRIGEVGTRIAGDQIRASIRRTDRELASLKPAVKRSNPNVQRRAVKTTAKIIELDSLALASLDASHPVLAIKQAMSARSYVDLIRQDVIEETVVR